MRMIAKTMLGALALATFAMAAAPADAARVTVTTTTRSVHAVPRTTCMTTGYSSAVCVHHGFYGRELRREAMLRHAVRHERHEAMRQAYLEHRYEHSY